MEFYMMEESCNSPKRESEIIRAYNELESVIEKLETIITSFDSKLVNVVRGSIPKDSSDDDCEKTPGYSAKLAQDIDKQVMNIKNLTIRLIDLRDRIEV